MRPDGYVKLNIGPYENGYKSHPFEHRSVMEQHLGRALGRHEVVHHVDGNRSNNHLSNLVVMPRSDHTSDHMKKVWAKRKSITP